MAGQGGRTRHPAEMEPRAGSAAPDRSLRLQRARWAAERQRRRPVAEIVCGEVSRRLLQKKRGLQTPGGPQNSYRFDFQYCEPADGTRAATEKGISARPAGSSALRYANHAIGGSGCVSSLCRLLARIGPTETSAIPLLSGAKRASAIA